jgi:hypothetical protein
MAGKSGVCSIQPIVQYIELNRAGWWKRAVQQFVLTVLVVQPLPRSKVREAIEVQIGVTLDPLAVLEAVDDLIASGQALDRGGAVSLAASTANAHLERSRQIEALEGAVRRQFEMAIQRGAPNAAHPDLWVDFCEKVLWPHITELGAKTVEALGRQVIDIPASPQFVAFLAEAKGGDANALRDALVNFLDPNDPNVRSFVLRRLNARFMIEASSLPEQVLQALAKSGGGPKLLALFLDTNFLVAVLGLHDDEANDAATLLLDLSARIQGYVHTQFYVLPETVDEMRELLTGVQRTLGDLRTRGPIAHAALSLRHSNLIHSFYRSAADSVTPLSPADFFGPIERNLVSLLEERGIAVSAEPHVLSTDQAVIDDLHDLEAYQTAHRRVGAKEYGRNLHDLILWHFVKRHQSSVAETPLEAGNAVVTLDRGLVTFDARKRAVLDQRAFPVVYDPATVVNLLQFWVPRDEALDKAIVGAFRLPFLLMEFDPAAEQVTARILQSLSAYENLETLPALSLVRILNNEALRSKIASIPQSTAEQETTPLVHSVAIDELREWARSQIAAVKDESDRSIDVLTRQVSGLAEEREDMKARMLDLEGASERLQAIESSMADGESRKAQRRAWRLVGLETSISLLFVAGSAAYVTVLGSRLPELVRYLGAGAFGLLAALGVFAWLVGQRRELKKSRCAGVMPKVMRILVAGAAAVLTSILGAIIYGAMTAD